MAERVPDAGEVIHTHAAKHPDLQIANAHVKAHICLPDPTVGFYRGTRFDWSGVIFSLQCEGHEYYGPWFTRRDPSVFDFVFRGAEIIAGTHSAITGPSEEFVLPQGYDDAKAGATFVKIGVGVLRKPDESAYSCYNDYEILDSGSWAIESTPTSVSFVQRLDNRSGYGYKYRKSLSLGSTKPELEIEHSLENTGRIALRTPHYNHNFLTLDRKPIGENLRIIFPFPVWSDAALNPAFVNVDGQQAAYRRMLVDDDVVAFPLFGFGGTAADYDVRIHDRLSGAGVRMVGDRPLTRLAVWSIRSVLSVEPFIEVHVEPAATIRWATKYLYGSAAGALLAANSLQRDNASQ